MSAAAMKKHFNAVLIDWREHLREEMQKNIRSSQEIKVNHMQIPSIEHLKKEEFAFSFEQEIGKGSL